MARLVLDHRPFRIDTAISDNRDLEHAIIFAEQSLVLDNIGARHQGTVGEDLTEPGGPGSGGGERFQHVSHRVNRLGRVSGQFRRSLDELRSVPIGHTPNLCVVGRHNHLVK